MRKVITEGDVRVLRLVCIGGVLLAVGIVLLLVGVYFTGLNKEKVFEYKCPDGSYVRYTAQKRSENEASFCPGKSIYDHFPDDVERP